MQSAELEVKAGTYGHVIKTCINAGVVSQAEALLEEMRAADIHVKSRIAALVAKHVERRKQQGDRGESAAISAARTTSPAPTTPPTTPTATHATATTTTATTVTEPMGTPLSPDGLPPPVWVRTETVPASVLGSSSSSSSGGDMNAANHTSSSPLSSQGTEQVGVETGSIYTSSQTGVASPPIPPLSWDVQQQQHARGGGGDGGYGGGEGGGDGRAKSPRVAVKAFLRVVGNHTKSRRWDAIVRELEDVTSDPATKVSMRMYEGCIAGLATGGRWVEALSVLEMMQGAGLVPAASCVTAAIRACAKATPPRWGLGLSLLRGMEGPDVWAYVATMSGLAKGGQWKTCASLLEEMGEVGLEPNM